MLFITNIFFLCNRGLSIEVLKKEKNKSYIMKLLLKSSHVVMTCVNYILLNVLQKKIIFYCQTFG